MNTDFEYYNTYENVLSELTKLRKRHVYENEIYQNKLLFHECVKELQHHYLRGRIKPSFIKHPVFYKYFWKWFGY